MPAKFTALRSQIEHALAGRVSSPFAYHEHAVKEYASTVLGVDLKQLLWVRCRNFNHALRAADLLLHDGGFSFVCLDLGVLNLEDETGIANAIITPQIYEQNHLTIVHQQFLLIDGRLQNQDNVVSVKDERVLPLKITKAETISHDFH